MWQPKVSIIIPVYNGSNYLGEAIDSAIGQTYPNIEIIVVNDGSNDDDKTEQIALSYGDKIVYIKKENGGVSSALNMGIKHMSGEYFSWLSHDDAYHPHKIEEQIKALKSLDDKKTIVLSNEVQIDANSSFMPNGKHNRKLKSNIIIDGNTALIDMFKYGTFYGCSLLIHRTLLFDSGLFDERYRFTQDFLMWTSILINGNHLIYVPKDLIYMRIHSGQLTQTGRQRFYDESLLSAKDIVSLILKNSENSNLLYYFARYNAIYNNKHVVNYVLQIGKRERILSFPACLMIRIVQIYGVIRPYIRRIYYRLIKKVKTQ